MAALEKAYLSFTLPSTPSMKQIDSCEKKNSFIEVGHKQTMDSKADNQTLNGCGFVIKFDDAWTICPNNLNYFLFQERIDFYFETLFETGVDEMSWDDTVNENILSFMSFYHGFIQMLNATLKGNWTFSVRKITSLQKVVP